MKTLQHSSKKLIERNMISPLIQIESLLVSKLTNSKEESRIILKNISFSLDVGEFFTLIGENGSGKSTLALSLTQLIPKNKFRIDGRAYFLADELLSMSESKLNSVRREKISYIFQNPFNAFDPIRTIGFQFNEIQTYRNFINDELNDYFIRLQLPDYKTLSKRYPFELSGGMLQRVSSVRAIIIKPNLIIADEPTSALDKPISNIFMNFLYEYTRMNQISILFITQDFEIAKKYSDRIGILKDGELIEIIPREKFLIECSSEYTEKLYSSYRSVYQ